MTAYIRSKSEPEKTTVPRNNNSSMGNDRSSVTVNILTTQEEFDDLESAWNGLLDNPEVEAHIFQTYEWQRLWWKNFGDDNDLQIFTVWSNNELVGLAPFFIEENSSGGLYEYKKLKFIGSSVSDKDAVNNFIDDTLSYYLDLIIQPDYQEEVVNEFISYLDRTREYVNSIQLDEFSEESIILNEVLIKIWQYGWQFYGGLTEASTQIMVSDSAEDKLPSSYNQLLQQDTKSENMYRICRVQDKKELDTAVNNFVELHEKQSNEPGNPERFSESKLKNFLEEVSKSFIEKNNLKMATVLDDNNFCVAVNIAFQFKDRMYSYHNAFDTQAAIDLLINSLVEDASINDIECIDMLKNKENHRDCYKSQTTRNLRVTIPGYAPKNSVRSYLNNFAQRTNMPE